MSKLRIIRNENIKRILIGTPKGHEHLRIVIELNDLTLILHEATVGNLSRAYMTIKTHPKIRAIELLTTTIDPEYKKRGYATHQLIETDRPQEEVEREISELTAD